MKILLTRTDYSSKKNLGVTASCLKLKYVLCNNVAANTNEPLPVDYRDFKLQEHRSKDNYLLHRNTYSSNKSGVLFEELYFNCFS